MMSTTKPTVRVVLSEVAGQLRLEIVTCARGSRRLLQALHEALASVHAFIERLEVRLTGEDVSAHLLLGGPNEGTISAEDHGALMAAVVGAIDRASTQG
jgi:hypothetical protein